MSTETNTNSKHAVIEDDDNLELPIDLVGEHVKSGRKILADYDQATGAIEVRPKFLGMTDIIEAKVREIEEWNKSQGAGLERVEIDPEAAKAQLEAASKALEKEDGDLAVAQAKAAPPSAHDPVAALTGKVDPVILALLQQQQELIQTLTGKKETEEERRLSRQKGLVAEGRRELERAKADILDDINFSQTNGVPLPPKKHPQHGDKDPHYVSWLKEHRPEKYRSRYGVTEEGRTLTVTKNGRQATVTADVARRKTHLTHKAEHINDLGPDMSWNA